MIELRKIGNGHERQIGGESIASLEGLALTGGALMEFLQQRLGKFKLPSVVEFADEPLPKTGTGKIPKLLIREKFWAGKEKRVQG